jgi:hypothetical protein
MLFVFWSVRGGSGVTTLATAVALAEPHAVLIEGGADARTMLSRSPHLPTDRDQPEQGLGEWIDASVEPDALTNLIHGEKPALIRLGNVEATNTPHRLAPGIDWLTNSFRSVVVDLGTAEGVLPSALVAAADRSILVLRPCMQSIRSAVASNRAADGVVIVGDGQRSIRSNDVGQLLGIPVLATVPTSMAVADAVNRSTLATSVPRVLQRTAAHVRRGAL